ncbi:MAG TPA: SsrA-binding protein SmpB [candidate division Zixibacteria bacterium]|nr:SsrA-binding protein SmpB [candidate division Zixibacteria bacterium]
MKEKEETKAVATNRKAFHLYHIEDKLEVGMVLGGTEVKSLRAGKANMSDAYAMIEDGELWLYNLHISPYEAGNRANPDPVRKRKLLAHKREIQKLFARAAQKGYTLVPLSIYFSDGRAKLELGVGVGKKLFDRREAIKERDLRREEERERRGRRA